VVTSGKVLLLRRFSKGTFYGRLSFQEIISSCVGRTGKTHTHRGRCVGDKIARGGRDDKIAHGGRDGKIAHGGRDDKIARGGGNDEITRRVRDNEISRGGRDDDL